jgi:hypothetical protein
MKFSSDKDIAKEVKNAIKRGWSYEYGKKHRRLRSPDGLSVVLINGSPSDHHAAANFKHDILKIERGR